MYGTFETYTLLMFSKTDLLSSPGSTGYLFAREGRGKDSVFPSLLTTEENLLASTCMYDPAPAQTQS